jgi:ubiquinone/menaquinone biosynthesis C-methylase UbiE
MSDSDRGQVTLSAAEVYDSLFVPALFGRFAEAIADAAQIRSDDQVLDVACGSGALTRAVRDRTAARVVGIDVNPAMIAVARHHGGTIEYMEGDGQNLPFGAVEFDVATCQFGVMFYPDPVRGIAELARVGRRGVIAVWDAIERSEGYSAMQQLFRDELGSEAAKSLDAPFAMGEAGALEALFDAARVQDVSYQSIEGTGRFDSMDEWVTTEVRGWTLGDSISNERLGRLVEVARDRLGQFQTADGCVFGISAKVATWAHE